MPATNKESRYEMLYLWFTRAKYTMGIFFVLFEFVYLLFGLLNEGPAIRLDMFTALEMVMACFAIGVAQQAIAPAEKLSRARCAAWVLTGIAITAAFSLVFGWFGGFAAWCLPLFIVIVALALLAMLYSLRLELEKETRNLNRSLALFQDRRET